MKSDYITGVNDGGCCYNALSRSPSHASGARRDSDVVRHAVGGGRLSPFLLIRLNTEQGEYKTARAQRRVQTERFGQLAK